MEYDGRLDGQEWLFGLYWRDGQREPCGDYRRAR